MMILIVRTTMNNWIPVSTLPEKRIRVIACDKLFVIGDVFYGYASWHTRYNDFCKERRPVEKWDELHWRYSLDESMAPTPTHWMPLPKLPE